MVNVSSVSHAFCAADKKAITTVECSYCFTKSRTFNVSEKCRAGHGANRSKFREAREIQVRLESL